MTDDRTCATCAHAYIVDQEWYSDPSLMKFNVDHFCSLINPDNRHCASYMQAHSTCKHWIQCVYPRHIWPKPSYEDMKAGIWHTDKNRRSGDVPETVKPHQSTLEAYQ